jgi:hypothetical protein
MQSEEFLWRVTQPDRITSFLRCIKHLASIDETITILLKPKRLDLFAESHDNSAALICTFMPPFFSEFRSSCTRVYAVYSKNLQTIMEAHKQSIISILVKIRREDFLDLCIEYNSGVIALYGCPFTDKVHEICQAGGPELPLYPSWVGDSYVLWEDRIMKLFPGSHQFLAIKLSSQGMEVRDFDFEKNQTGIAGHPIKIPRGKIQVFEPQKEIEITSIPFPRLKMFMITAKKCKFSVQMSPEYNESISQTYWQCFDERKNAYFTLFLGCDVLGDKMQVKKETQEDYDITSFRNLD